MEELIESALSKKLKPGNIKHKSNIAKKGNIGDCNDSGDKINKPNLKKKILIVGTGGIGCELLKNLLMCDFRDIEIVDLDTIELSNLNRQFLFRQCDIRKAKSHVAKERASAFNTRSKITSHQCDIRSAEKGIHFFQKFDLVMNALDNVATRRHVNRVCSSLNIPLVESGTQGYAGQVYAIFPHKTECYECVEHPAPKTFPVCTIRDTPEKPVHCIAWAKLMFDSLFGPISDQNELSDLKLEKLDNETPTEFAKRLFTALFDVNIRDRLKNKRSDSESSEPDFDPEIGGENGVANTDESQHQRLNTENTHANNAEENEPTSLHSDHTNLDSGPKPLSLSLILNRTLYEDEKPNGSEKMVAEKAEFNAETAVRSLRETAKDFLTAVEAVFAQGLLGQVVFDKDNEVSMDFVSSAANLRMENFGIERMSRFTVKGIAGNIVHAIATTNAVCAGLMAIEATKILVDNYDVTNPHTDNDCRRSWIQLNTIGTRVVERETLSSPNPQCIVCSQQVMNLYCNVRGMSVGTLFRKVLRETLSLTRPIVDVSYGGESNFISEDLEEWDGNERWMKEYFSHPLAHESVKIDHGSILTVSDDSQSFSMRIIVVHCQNLDTKDDQEAFRIEKQAPYSIDESQYGRGEKRSLEDGQEEGFLNKAKTVVDTIKRLKIAE